MYTGTASDLASGLTNKLAKRKTSVKKIRAKMVNRFSKKFKRGFIV